MCVPRVLPLVALVVFCCVLCTGCPFFQWPWGGVETPDTVGMTQDEAEQAILGAGLTLGDATEDYSYTIAEGHVISQSPEAGARVARNTAVALVMSLGSGIQPLAIRTSGVTVVLPDGMTAPESLSVLTCLGQASLDGDGAGTLAAFEAGPQLAVVIDENDSPLLLGWTGEEATEISARTTAEVLVFWAAACQTLPPDGRAAAIDLLQQENLGDLEAAIADALVTAPDVFEAPNAAVEDALRAAVECFIPEKGLLVQPADALSGIQVDITRGVNTIRLTNMYRRKAHVFIDRTSYTPDGGTPVYETVPLTSFKLDSVGGLGSVLSTFSSIVSGSYAYTYVSSDELALPTVAGAEKTTYRVATVGMGVGRGDYDQLTDTEKDKQFEVAAWFVVTDVVWPAFSGVILPICTYGGSGSIDWWQYEGLPTYVDLVNTIIALDGFPQAVAAGNVSGAALIALNAIADNAGVQALVTNLVWDIIYHSTYGSTVDAAHASGLANTAMQGAQKVFNAVGVANILLGVFDLGRVVYDIAHSNCADIWTVDVTPPRVLLEPSAPTLASTPTSGQSVTLTASVPDATGSVGTAPTFAYHWDLTTTTGEAQGHSGETSFDSSSASIVYQARANSEGEDTVTATVYEVRVKKQVERILVGSATATVTVEKVDPEMHYGYLYSEIQFEPPDGPCGWRVGVEFEKWPDPQPSKYELYGYNFNDTAYYGTSLYLIGPPWGTMWDAETAATIRLRLTSGGGSCPADIGPLEDSVAWGLSRFEGGIWEITPIY